MPLFEKKTNPNPTNPSQKPSGLVNTLGSLLPLTPFVYDQIAGQKVPPLTGTIAEMQLALTSIQTTLQTITQNQQELAQRLMNLENTAQTQLTNLTQQFQSLRLTHTKEKKEIEYNPVPEIDH